MARRLPLGLVVGALVTTAAACGGSNKGAGATTHRLRVSPKAEAAYEQAYTECASTPLRRLATKYAVDENPQAVARGVGAAWAQNLGAGAQGVRAATAGCRDGFESRTGGT